MVFREKYFRAVSRRWIITARAYWSSYKTRNRATKPPAHCVNDLRTLTDVGKDSGLRVEIAVVVIPDVDSRIATSIVLTTPEANNRIDLKAMKLKRK